MRILVTGAKGFIGKNLCANLRNLQEGKDRTRPLLKIDEVFEFDMDSDSTLLDTYCQRADFVFNLAGVNRPKSQDEFMKGNYDFASTLLDTLRKHGNTCPVMLSSSQQASLSGRFGDSEYGRSKKASEGLFLKYQEETGAKALVYRFPNIFGKWCRPNYNSAIATFCHNMANDLPIQVNDRSVEMELLYIDDFVNEMLDALEGKEHRCEFNGLNVIPTTDGTYCYAPVTHQTTLGNIVDILEQISKNGKPFETPLIMEGQGESYSLTKKLYATYLSYLPKEKIAFPLQMNKDHRGSFTELLHTLNCGQVSINISKPGVTRGQHWHNTKWEYFIVVAGHGLIQMRNMNTSPLEGKGEILEFEVSGDNIQCVHMLPGYTHNIINLSDTENLVTVMYASEVFNPNKTDTFYETV